MHSVAKRIIAVLTLLLPTWAAAQTTAFASWFDTLYRIDLSTGQGQEIGAYGSIGPTEIGDMEGLAMSGDGTLYGVFDGLDMLVRLDKNTGAATFVGPLDIAGQGAGDNGNGFDFGLAFTCDGRLWMSSDTTGKLWQVDPGTGKATFVTNTGHPITGLASRDNVLYGIGGQGDQGLYTIDPDTGVTTPVGTLTVPGNVRFQDAGLDFDAEGHLWATVDYNPQPDGVTYVDKPQIIEINPRTAQALSVRQIGGIPRQTDFEGLAISPPICDGGGPGGGLQLSVVPALGHVGLGFLAFAFLAFALLWMRQRQRQS